MMHIQRQRVLRSFDLARGIGLSLDRSTLPDALRDIGAPEEAIIEARMAAARREPTE